MYVNETFLAFLFPHILSLPHTRLFKHTTHSLLILHHLAVIVRFCVSGKIPVGQEIRACGSHRRLGAWNSVQAMNLRWGSVRVHRLLVIKLFSLFQQFTMHHCGGYNAIPNALNSHFLPRVAT